MLTIFPVPAFTDNYLWVIHNGNNAVVVDPGDAVPVINYLLEHQLHLSAILVTHHHADHVGGVGDLLDWCGESIPVFGPATEIIPHRTQIAVSGKNVAIAALGLDFDIVDVPGHTLGHIVYYEKKHRWLFCGDTLFAGGCGRLFEGTPLQMLTSLAKLRALPADTQFFCAHEYTLGNLRFASAVEPENPALQQRIVIETAKRARGEPTLPSTIGFERATNPFLRWDAPDVIAAACQYTNGPLHPDSPAHQIFGAIREWKNNF